MPEAGVAHNIAVVDIRTDYAGQALKAASSLWGAGQMMFNKFMVVTASGRPVRDVAALADLLRRIRIPDDLMFSRGPLDVLDHAAPETGLGGKLRRVSIPPLRSRPCSCRSRSNFRTVSCGSITRFPNRGGYCCCPRPGVSGPMHSLSWRKTGSKESNM